VGDLDAGRQRAVEYIHELGVARKADLVDLIAGDGIQLTQRELAGLDDEYLDVVHPQGTATYVSTLADGPLGLALRTMRHFGVADECDVRGGLRRALGSGKGVATIGRDAGADIALGVLSVLLDDWDDVEDADMTADAAVLRRFDDAHGGVLPRPDIEASIPTSTAGPFKRNLSYITMVEMVANGVFGRRGAVIDLAAVESLRAAQRVGPWCRWGRLDRRRLWIDVKTAGRAFRGRFPQDCYDILGNRVWALLMPGGRELGELSTVAGAGELAVSWRVAPPNDWTSGDHGAVIEFDVADNTARLYSGVANGAAEDPRYVDGCALVDGRWTAVVELDDRALRDDRVRVPLAVDGLAEIGVGHRQPYRCGQSEVGVFREPHSYRVDGLAAILGDVPDGTFVRLSFRDSDCGVVVAPPPADTIGRLLASVGIFESVQRPWAVLGAALGVGGGADQRAVRRAFADRERFDLAQLTRELPKRRSSGSNDDSVEVNDFRCAGHHLVQSTARGLYFAEPVPGIGPLGLRWSRTEPGMSSARDWAIETLVILRVWAASNDIETLVVERSEGGWTSALVGPEQTLRGLLRRIADLGGHLDARRLNLRMPGVPLSPLGYVRMYARAERDLQKLVVTADGWTATSNSGDEHGPAPVAALSLA
jgi:hypothetical protein